MKLLTDASARELLDQLSKLVTGFERTNLRKQTAANLSSYCEINRALQSHLEHIRNDLLVHYDTAQKELKDRVFGLEKTH